MRFDAEKFHRRSMRIKNQDYSRPGYYFITICARNRENLFTDLYVVTKEKKGQPRELPLHQKSAPAHGPTYHMILTDAGRIIEKNWHEIAKGIIKTDAFVIMPNHIHGIIIIKSHALCVGAGLAPAPVLQPIKGQPQGLPLHKEFAPAPVLQPIKGQPQGLPLHKEFAPAPVLQPIKGQPQGLPLHGEIAPTPTLGAIIGAFKSRCVRDYLKFIDKNNLNESAKIWQRNYHEHIIRNRKELATIRNYIKSNPVNWAMDEDNPLNY